jgi:hypothetical protein
MFSARHPVDAATCFAFLAIAGTDLPDEEYMQKICRSRD